MGASAYIGRVGSLAVALGVGAAIATGQGVAWASPTETDSSKSSTSAPADANSDSNAASDASTTKLPATEPSSETPASDPETAAPADEAEAAGSQAGSADADNEVASPSARQPKKRSATTTVRIEKKASDRPAAKAADVSTSSLSATTSTVDVADKVTIEKPATTLQPNPLTVVPATVASPTAITLSAPRTMVATSQPTAAQLTLPRLVTNLLSAFGLGSLAANIPGVPSWSPLGLALLALGARRETEQTVSTAGAPVAALALTPTAATLASEPGTTRTPVWVSTNTQFIEYVTGPGNLNDTQRRFGIGGTDLGIMWDNGIADDPTTAVNEHQVLIAFGDTFSNSFPVRSGIWRMNTLFRSSDTNLSNGLYVPAGIQNDPGKYSGSPMTDPNFSREILGHPAYGIGPEVTIIPTAAISVPGAGPNGGTRQYMNFMAVRSWDSPGRWTTNYSGIAYSDDNGQNWRAELVPASSIRTAAAGRSTVPYVSGNQNFQQGAFVKPPAGSPDAAAGWVYSYGTPAGRGGTVYLSRVNQYQILDQTKYQYWNGTQWVANNPAAAKPILPGKQTTGFFGFGATTVYPSVGEMSVQYNPYLKKYVMLYADGGNNVVMRTSDTPQGTWSAPKTLVTSAKMPGLYAPMIHPWSGTTNVPDADQKYLFWNLSTWDNYEVRLMRTDLTMV